MSTGLGEVTPGPLCVPPPLTGGRSAMTLSLRTGASTFIVPQGRLGGRGERGRAESHHKTWGQREEGAAMSPCPSCPHIPMHSIMEYGCPSVPKHGCPHVPATPRSLSVAVPTPWGVAVPVSQPSLCPCAQLSPCPHIPSVACQGMAFPMSPAIATSLHPEAPVSPCPNCPHIPSVASQCTAIPVSH